MEDERYDEMMWERYEDEGEWTGWQGRYTPERARRPDPYLERLNRASAGRGWSHNRVIDGALSFESPTQGPYVHSSRQAAYDRAQERAWSTRPPLRSPGASNQRREWWQVPGPYVGVGPQGYRRSDGRIWEEICDRLTEHGAIDARDIGVEVHFGEVLLEGTVDSRQAKRRVEDLAEVVPGVKDVHNRLRVARSL